VNNKCVQCPAGTWSDTPSSGVTSCTPCQQGKYNPNPGATSIDACISCTPGTYNNATGGSSLASCTPCPAGTVSSAAGATSSSTCQPCPEGTAAGRPGQTSCTTCSYRTIATAGSASCIPCATGTYKISSNQCTSCTNNSFCPIASIEEEGQDSLDFISTTGGPRTPKAKYQDVTLNPDLDKIWYESYIVWVKIVMVVVGVTLILTLVVGLGFIMCMRPQLRKKIRVLDLWYYYAHWLERKQPLLYHPTLLGAQLSMITICVIFLVLGFILFSFLTDNKTFTMTSNQIENIPLLPGDYIVNVVFHSFDSNYCNGNATDTGFKSENNITYAYQRISQTGCLATWTCKNPCQLSNFNQLVSFTLTTPGALAYAIDYNVSAPYMDDTYSLIDGRLTAPSINQVLRGSDPTIVGILATFTRFEYYSNYIFPPPLTFSQNKSGMALQFVNNITGSVADATTFSSQANMVTFNLVFTLNPLTSKIAGIPKQTVFMVLSQISAVSTLLITIFTVTFPIIDIAKQKIESKVKEAKLKKARNRFTNEEIITDVNDDVAYHELASRSRSNSSADAMQHIPKELRETLLLDK
jgi:hypothetical protein